MKPIKFEGADVTYAENQPEYLSLPTKKVDDNTILTCWELTDDEVKKISDTKKLWLGVMNFNKPLQPLLPSVDRWDIDRKPIKKDKVCYCFGVKREHAFSETFESIEDLLMFAKRAWDNTEEDYFDGTQDCIYIGIARFVSVPDCAPSIKDLACQITDNFYSNYNVDDDDDCQISTSMKEAEEDFKKFLNKHFELPSCTSFVTSWEVGVYNLRDSEWVEKYIKAEDEYGC